MLPRSEAVHVDVERGVRLHQKATRVEDAKGQHSTSATSRRCTVDGVLDSRAIVGNAISHGTKRLRAEPCGGIWAPRLEAEVIEQSCGVGTIMCAVVQPEPIAQQQRQHQQKLSHLFGHVGR